MKDELGGKIIREFAALRTKAYCYLIDDGGQYKSAKGRRNCVIKRNLKFKDYEYCKVDSLRQNYKEFLKNNRIILRSEQKFKIKKHNVYTEEVKKIVLSATNDKRIQPIDSIETYAMEQTIICYIKKNKLNVMTKRCIKNEQLC